MGFNRFINISAVVMVLLFVLFGMDDGVKAQSKPYQLIGNQTGLKEVSIREAKELLKGRNSLWANGEVVSIALPSSKSDYAELVAREIYGTSVNGMQKYWLSLVIQGRGSSPAFFTKPEELLDWVRRTPGAIGILPADFGPVPANLSIKLKD
jgi:hypothetical protein